MKHFDDILRDKLNKIPTEKTPNEGMWKNIQSELSASPQKASSFNQQIWTGIAATTILGGVIITASNQNNALESYQDLDSKHSIVIDSNQGKSNDEAIETIALASTELIEHKAQEAHEITLKIIAKVPEPKLTIHGEPEGNIKNNSKNSGKDNTDIKVADTEDSETDDSTIDELASIDFKAAGIQCENSTINFKTINEHNVPGEVQWIFDSVHLRDGEDTDFEFEEAGKHLVHMIFRAESGEIINIKKEFTVHAIPSPEIDIIESEVLETFSREVHVTAHPNTNTYQWYVDGKYLGKSDSLKAFLKPGWHDFAVKAINEYGCTNKLSKSQIIEDGLQIYISNAFTPNYDDLNDTWFPQNLEQVEDFYIKIIRKADLSVVFETKTLKPWNGQLPNGNMPRAGEQFFVQIIATDKRGDVQQFEEVLTIPTAR